MKLIDMDVVILNKCIFVYNLSREEIFMKNYVEMNKQELNEELVKLKAEYKKYQEMSLSLNMARGKPCIEQLDLSMGLMDALNSDADLSCEDGTDCRNYGVLTGIDEAKVLIGAMMENKPENIIIYGNSSLNVMYDTVSRAYTHGVMGKIVSKYNQFVNFFFWTL